MSSNRIFMINKSGFDYPIYDYYKGFIGKIRNRDSYIDLRYGG